MIDPAKKSLTKNFVKEHRMSDSGKECGQNTDQAIRSRNAQETPKRQYYYHVDGCHAESSISEECVCWHDAGTGPMPDGYWYDANMVRKELQWRDKLPEKSSLSKFS